MATWPITAVVFDFDGVLADSEPLHLAAYQEVFASVGIALTRDEYYARYLGYDDEGLVRAMSSDRGWNLDDRQVAALVDQKARAFEDILARSDVLYPGAEACVERLAGVYPLGIASGALRHEIELVLRRHGLLEAFRFIVASGDTPASKPAPDPYRRAADLHGVAPSACVAIEDSLWGIESAISAGLRCVAVSSTYPRDQLSLAHLVIDSLEELTVERIRALG